MATVTYDLIASQTLGSAAASITFSSIAASWTDLRVVLVGTPVTASSAGIQFNSDTGTNYSFTGLYGDGTTASSFSTNNSTYVYGSNTNTSYSSFILWDIFSYAGSTYKTVLSSGSLDMNGTGYVRRSVGLWRNTSAINSITIMLAGGNSYNTGTTAQLYGIKSA